MQGLDEMGHELELAKEDLDECRSHLARQKSEAECEAEEFANLEDDVAIVWSDYKMKILSAFFRMNQGKWFGRRGAVCLGFGVCAKARDGQGGGTGQHIDVNCVLMMTDDNKQDEGQVVCAKAHLHNNHLPEHIKRVHFRTDGAGCFRSALHRAIQPIWSLWTGITEETLTIYPAGGGKTSLDGTFGRFGVALRTSVDRGNSHCDAKTILAAVEDCNGLPATSFLGFLPDRANRFCVKFLDGIDIDSVLRSKLDPTAGCLRLCKHSGHGSGLLIRSSDVFCFNDDKKGRKQPKKKDVATQQDSFHLTENILPRILEFIVGVESEEESTVIPWTPAMSWSDACLSFNRFCARNSLPLLSMAPCLMTDDRKPVCTDTQKAKNEKEAVRSSGVSPSGEGPNDKRVRQRRRVSRAEALKQKTQTSIEVFREEKAAAGLFLCCERCPTTNRHCAFESLSETRLRKHLEKGKHSFATGVSAKDKLVLLASGAGGSMAVGSRPDRSSSAALSRPIEETVVGAPGADAAICIAKFNRKGWAPPTYKTVKQIEFLQECFDARPMMDECRTRRRMAELVNPVDGGPMFCWSKRGTQAPKGGKKSRAYCEWEGCQVCGKKPCSCNGGLLSHEQIKAHFGALAQKRNGKNKKKRKAADETDEHDEDEYEGQLIAALEGETGDL
jgi:hypothetical protein